MTITTVAPVVGPNGVTAPSYADILSFIRGRYQQIFGADVYVDPDSQDGQFQAVLAEAFYDMGSACVAVYRSFSPATASGDALSSNVKINGIARSVATFSTVDVQIGGTVGTTITNGAVKDANGNTWKLPATVTIPGAGVITVTATAQTAGAIDANPHTVTTIATPTRGWQTVDNPSAATPGEPVESDAELRAKQAVSVAIPSRTVLEGIIGAVASIPGVARYRGFENDTGTADANGIPGHRISLVVDGGDAATIAQAIAAKKTPGTGTYGTTTVTVTDIYGIPHPINFFRPTDVPITAAITLKALVGYNTATGEAVQQAVSDYINAVAIGGGLSGAVEWDSAIAAAKSVAGANTFKISSLTLSGPGGAGTPDVPIAFNASATSSPADIVLTVS